MDDGGSACLLKISDAFLSHSIRMMGASTTEGDRLTLSFDIIHPSLLCKATIISMIMLNNDSMASAEELKSSFRLQSFLHVAGFLKMDERQRGCMVHKHGGEVEPAFGDEPSHLSNETRSC